MLPGRHRVIWNTQSADCGTNLGTGKKACCRQFGGEKLLGLTRW